MVDGSARTIGSYSKIKAFIQKSSHLTHGLASSPGTRSAHGFQTEGRTGISDGLSVSAGAAENGCTPPRHIVLPEPGHKEHAVVPKCPDVRAVTIQAYACMIDHPYLQSGCNSADHPGHVAANV